MDKPESLRLFIGIGIEPSHFLKTKIESLKKDLSFCKINWVPSGNYHITLNFIGDKPQYYVNTLKKIINESIKKYKPFKFTLSEIGYFGKKLPSVLWIGIDDCPELTNLQETLYLNLKEHGMIEEDNRFNAHLTIGRIKKAPNIYDFNSALNKYAERFQTLKVNSILLFESKLTNTGAEYIKLSSHEL